MLWQPECSALLDALEQFACIPEIASMLSRSLLQILQLSPEKTLASFRELNAMCRVLKVACIQAKKSRRPDDASPIVTIGNMEGVSSEKFYSLNMSTLDSQNRSMTASVELFKGYFSAAEDAKSLVLSNIECVDCVFDLFWEKNMRNLMLGYILDLMKVVLSLCCTISVFAVRQYFKLLLF